MLKLITDPRVFPVREVDLSGANDDVAAVPRITSLGNKNMKFERPDGGTNVVFRSRRASVDIDLNMVPHKTAKALYELAGMSRQNREKANVMIAPNLDRSTVISALLARSLRFWRKDTAAGKFEIADPSATTLTDTRYQLDDDGFLSAVGAGVARFEPGGIGRKLRVENGFKNLLSPSHPAIGSTLWSAGTGAPEITFDDSIESVVRGKTGATSVRAIASGTHNWWLTSQVPVSAFVGYFHIGEWLRGVGDVSLGIKPDGGSWDFAPAVTLDPDLWTFVSHSVFTAGADILFHVENNRFSSGPLFETLQGPIIAYAEPNLAIQKRYYQQWSELSSDAPEKIDIGPFRMPREFTISFCGTVPPRSDANDPYLFDLRGGVSSDSAITWGTSGPRLTLEGTGGPTPGLSTPEIDDNAGQPYVCIFRFDSVSATFKTRIVILKADRTVLDREASLSVTSIYKVAEDIDTIRPGATTDSTKAAACGALIGELRIDRRAWSDAETDLFANFSTLDEWADLRFVTEGKLFELVDLTLEPIEGRWGDYAGVASFQEVDTIDDGSVSYAI